MSPSLVTIQMIMMWTGIGFQSILVYLVGTEQANSFYVNLSFDPSRNFSYLRKTKVCDNFVRAIHFEYFNFKNKSISSPVCN